MSEDTTVTNATKDLISTAESAQILGVSPDTLKKWRSRKLFGVPFFPADVKLGTDWYYHRERIEQLKSVYQKGTLQNMYKLSRGFSDYFQNGGTSGEKENLLTDLFRAEEVANFFDISVRTLQIWNESKKFVPFIIDHAGDFHYTREQLMQLKALRDKENKKSAPLKTLPRGQSMKNFFDQPENDVLTAINFQIYPAKKRIEINDKMSKIVFRMNDENYKQLVDEHKTQGVIEVRNHKKFGRITSSFTLQNADGYTDREPLDEFHRAVLSVCIANWLEGNRYITPAIIYRGITGKVNKKSNSKPSKDQLTAIIAAIDKLMFTQFDPNVKEALEQLKYANGDEAKITKSALLPCYRAEVTINGQKSDVICFDRRSPLLEISELKKQLITYDAELLDIPNQNNSILNITLKNYVMRRVQEIKLHKLHSTLTFKDIFCKCRIEDAPGEIKRRVREYIKKFFAHLQDKQVIKSFEITKKHNAFYSVKFTY